MVVEEIKLMAPKSTSREGNKTYKLKTLVKLPPSAATLNVHAHRTAPFLTDSGNNDKWETENRTMYKSHSAKPTTRHSK